MHTPLTSPPTTVQRDEKNKRTWRPSSIAVVAAVLLMQTPYAHAQHASAPAGPSEKEKAKAAEKRALIRYWHKADIWFCITHVRFWG